MCLMISWSIASVNGNGIFVHKHCLTPTSLSNEGSVFITVEWKYLLYAPHYGTMSASSFIYYYYFWKFDSHQVSQSKLSKHWYTHTAQFLLYYILTIPFFNSTTITSCVASIVWLEVLSPVDVGDEQTSELKSRFPPVTSIFEIVDQLS